MSTFKSVIAFVSFVVGLIIAMGATEATELKDMVLLGALGLFLMLLAVIVFDKNMEDER